MWLIYNCLIIVFMPRVVQTIQFLRWPKMSIQHHLSIILISAKVVQTIQFLRYVAFWCFNWCQYDFGPNISVYLFDKFFNLQSILIINGWSKFLFLSDSNTDSESEKMMNLLFLDSEMRSKAILIAQASALNIEDNKLLFTRRKTTTNVLCLPDQIHCEAHSHWMYWPSPYKKNFL